ncbi:MFS transporter [Aeromicrobium fastidiosum]|uniref:MFS transporter n=1 Tax=Aeromicrobium fastidiosum TaxID=52699 RepID=A0A641ARF9_9ACTN|nr:MFS transporter [Aeromicrobium fastidiosum]KAA1380694.1 MFS transporter [Aeromicrobium fastidiosum]MBP2390306.1 EmrB/QacA subfamily drug resistance transporter [Aeromicrobium fastidiosum]
MDDRRNIWALVAVALATFMTYLDNNIINVAIPVIEDDLGLSTAGMEWVVSSYILTFAGLMLIGGRLADLLGRRRIFLMGLGVFTVASLGAGLAGNVEMLIGARAVQGVGAALLTPTTLAIISATFTDKRERNVAVGVWGAVGALALAAGPLLGGLLSQHVAWEWIFFINVPLGLATAALAVWAIDESRDAVERRLDLWGLVASTISLSTLTFALIEGNGRGWDSAPILLSFAVAAVTAAWFVRVELTVTDPMVDLGLFRDRVYTGALVSLMLWAFGLFGIYFFTSLYLQGVLGFSPTRAGLTFVPMALCMAVAAASSEGIARRFGAHRSVSLGMGLMGVSIASVALFGQDAGMLDLMPSFVAMGIGGGLTIPLTAVVLGIMPQDQAGVASGVFNTSRELAGLLGITVIGVILTSRQDSALASGALPLDAFLSGYRLGLLVAGALVVAGAAAAWAALRRVDDEAVEHPDVVLAA